MRTMRETQTRHILEHLINNGSITSFEAFELYGATRLSAIIYSLRKQGYDIETLDCVAKNRYGGRCVYGRYRLKRLGE